MCDLGGLGSPAVAAAQPSPRRAFAHGDQSSESLPGQVHSRHILSIHAVLTALLLLLLAVPAYAADTGFKVSSDCDGTAVAVSAGDNDGFERTGGAGTPDDACTSNNGYLIDDNSGTGTSLNDCGTFPQAENDQHDFLTFAFGVPAGATINGIEVTAELKVDNVTNSPQVCVALSWNAGVSWTAAKTTGTLTTSDVVYTLGGAADLWGRAWADTEFSDLLFRVRLMPEMSNVNTRDFDLDHLQVKVYYTEAGGAACPARRLLMGVGC